MELLATLLVTAGIFVALAFVAALPLVLLLQRPGTDRDDGTVGTVGSTTPGSG